MPMDIRMGLFSRVILYVLPDYNTQNPAMEELHWTENVCLPHSHSDYGGSQDDKGIGQCD